MAGWFRVDQARVVVLRSTKAEDRLSYHRPELGAARGGNRIVLRGIRGALINPNSQFLPCLSGQHYYISSSLPKASLDSVLGTRYSLAHLRATIFAAFAYRRRYRAIAVSLYLTLSMSLVLSFAGRDLIVPSELM